MMGNELVFFTPDAAFETVKQLLTHGSYVVMISMEEDLWIVNYEYSKFCNRNDVVFMSREQYESEMLGREEDDDG